MTHNTLRKVILKEIRQILCEDTPPDDAKFAKYDNPQRRKDWLKLGMTGCTGLFGVTDHRGYNARWVRFSPQMTNPQDALEAVRRYAKHMEGAGVVKYSEFKVAEKTAKRIIVLWVLPDSSD